MRFAQEISIFNPHAIEMAVVALGTQITQTAEEIRLEAAQTLSNYSTTAQMNAAISTKANEITSEVSQTYATQQSVNNSVSSLSTRITQNANSISSEVTARGNADSALSSRIQQTLKSITFNITNNSTNTAATLSMSVTNEGGSTTALTSKSINLTGLVTFTNLSTSGQTTINGNNITTGVIKDANSNTTFNLSTGALTIKRGSINLGSGNFTVTDAGVLTALTGYIGNWQIENETLHCGSDTTYVCLNSNMFSQYAMWAGANTGGAAPFYVKKNGELKATAATITGTIISSTINNGRVKISSSGEITVPYVRILNDNNVEVGGILIDSDTVGNNSNKRIWTGHGFRISSEEGEWFKCDSAAIFTANVCAANGNIQFVSDRRKKKDIVPLTDAEQTIMALKPVAFKLIDHPEKTHHGFIAQDVQTLVHDNWSIVGELESGDNTTLTLSYTELIADLVATAQAQDKRITALERGTHG